jgi:hypothetical protein
MGAEIASSVKSEQPIEYDIHFFRDWLLTLSFVTIIPMLRRFFPTYACNRFHTRCNFCTHLISELLLGVCLDPSSRRNDRVGFLPRLALDP